MVIMITTHKEDGTSFDYIGATDDEDKLRNQNNSNRNKRFANTDYIMTILEDSPNMAPQQLAVSEFGWQNTLVRRWPFGLMWPQLPPSGFPLSASADKHHCWKWTRFEWKPGVGCRCQPPAATDLFANQGCGSPNRLWICFQIWSYWSRFAVHPIQNCKSSPTQKRTNRHLWSWRNNSDISSRTPRKIYRNL